MPLPLTPHRVELAKWMAAEANDLARRLARTRAELADLVRTHRLTAAGDYTTCYLLPDGSTTDDEAEAVGAWAG